VTTTISPPIRILALVGVLAAVALGLLMFAHSRSGSSSGSSATPAPSTSGSSSKPATTPATTPAVKPAPKPSVVLLPYLPAPVAHSLEYSKVVVVAVFSRDVSADQATVAQARDAAKAAHAGFAAVNVLDDRSALRISKLAGTSVAPPVILLVKRPGKVVNQFASTVDSDVIAQAALDAGAGR